MANTDVDVATTSGHSCIAVAAERGDLELAQLLMFHGADVNAADDQGITPLHLACRNGHRKLSESLLKAGAMPNVKAKGKLTPAMAAYHNGHSDIVKLLIKYGATAPNKKDNQGETWGSYFKDMFSKAWTQSVRTLNFGYANEQQEYMAVAQHI